MSKELFPTGQTSGITGIPPQTLRRYVQDFKEFFSETAQKPTKGRRFTPQDINHLLLIRHLYYERIPPEQIRAALRGEWKPAATPQYNNQDALVLVQAAQECMESAGEYAKQARQAANQAKATVDAASHTLRQFRDVINRRLEEPTDYLPRIAELERRLAVLEKSMNQKKRGLFGLG